MTAKLVACTTIRQGREANPVERIRSEVALDTFRLLRDQGIPTIAVYIETRGTYLRNLSRLQVTAIPQIADGMGSARRQALQTSQASFPDAKSFSGWNQKNRTWCGLPMH